MTRNFILLSGGPGLYDRRDPDHDGSWSNYVDHPLRLTKTSTQRRAFKAADEEVWWFIYRPAYDSRWTNDVGRSDRRHEPDRVKTIDCGRRKCQSYVDLLEYRARERGWHLRWFLSAADFWRRLSSFNDPISRLYYWGHARNDLWLRLEHDSAGSPIAPASHEIIRVSDIAGHSGLRSKFQAGNATRRHIFTGCNTHTFAREWTRVFRVHTRGFQGTLRFGTLSSTGHPTPAPGCTLRNYRPDSSTGVTIETESLDAYLHEGSLAETPHKPNLLASNELYREIAFSPNRKLVNLASEHFTHLGHPGEALDISPQVGDLLVRFVPFEGIFHSGVVISESVESATVLTDRGVPVEWAGAGAYVEVLEVPFGSGPVRSIGRRVTDSQGRMLRGQMILRAAEMSPMTAPHHAVVPVLNAKQFEAWPDWQPDTGVGQQTVYPPMEEDAPFSEDSPNSDDLIAQWVIDNSSLILLAADQNLYILPSRRFGVLVPPARLQNVDWRQVIVANDLGPLLGLPPVGAGGSRIFRDGPRLGVMIDAGRHPTRQPAAVYLDHIAARMRDLGVSEIRSVLLIHRHSDHFNEIVRMVREFNVSPQNIFIPRAYQNQQPQASFTRVIQALRQHFGDPRWNPTYINLRPASASGELLRGRYRLGETTFEFLGLASALNNVRRQTDRASLLTRVSRRGEAASIVVHGDLRGRDLQAFENAMGSQAWRDFYQNVTMVSGFSHHRGALTADHVDGILRLLDSTLLRTGRLTVLEQTDPRHPQYQQARADTLEFMRRIGIEVRESHTSQTGQPSGVQAGTQSAQARGPFAQSHQAIPSGLTEALTRINRLYRARQTLALWGPHIAQSNPDFNTTAQLRQIDQSLATLRASARNAIQAAAAVRTAGARTAQGGLDYTVDGRGVAFQSAINRIPGTTQAETAIGQTGFQALERLQRIPAREVPLHVALRDALINGRYNRQAFQYMLTQLDPVTRRSIFTGPRGGPRGQLAVFQRVRAEFGFRQAVLGNVNLVGAGHLRPGRRAAARGIGGLLLAIELGNIAGQAVQTYRISRTTARKQNIAPFLRRLAFWRQLRAQPAVVAVDDGLFGHEFERDVVAIDNGLRNDDWDFLFIEHTTQRPALSDADIQQVIAVLAYNIRNYDEYATLFEDSGQDAIRFRSSGPWTEARWEVHVGRFETSGTNRIIERWEELPLLTQGMQKLAARIIHNTSLLLRRIGRGESSDTDTMGTLQHPSEQVLYRARLREGIPASEVELRPTIPNVWAGNTATTPQIRHRVQWQTQGHPNFFVWAETSTHVRVTGADFNTYTRLRDLLTERYEVVATQRSLNDLQRSIVGNEKGDAWLPKNEIVRI